MSEQTQNNNQQMIVIALVVIAALLAAIVGVVVYQTTQKVPAPVAAVPDAPAAGAQPPAGMGGNAAAPAADAPFDAKTATKVPAGMTPEAVVKAYNEGVIAGKYAEAYKLLPAANSYGNAKSFEDQVKPYGITTYNMGKPVEEGDTVTIDAEQVTPQMPITYTWTFKKVGDQWFVASRAMANK